MKRKPRVRMKIWSSITKIEMLLYITQVFYILSMMYDESLHFKTKKNRIISQNNMKH